MSGAAGGVFKLIANDGKADRMIMATALLNQRIKDVMCARRRAGKADITPTLTDLERTHILFVNAHFKPFAAIGYEYNKVRPQSGNPQLNNPITFSIPQFGDFFHDMVGRQVLSSFWSSLQASPAQGTIGTGAFGITQQFASFPADTTDWDNATALLNSFYSLVDPFGNAVTAGTADAYRNLVRYCEWPGERLYQNVKFDVNGNPLDEYDDLCINMIRAFTIGQDKIVGYSRLVGQERCLEGFSGPQVCRVEDLNLATPSQAPELTNSDPFVPTPPTNVLVPATRADFLNNAFPNNAIIFGQAANAAPVANATNFYNGITRRCEQAVNGPQTPKYWQAPLEIWNKLRFWFNDDARLSIPSVSIPFGQRFITVTLAPQNLLTFEFPGLFVRQVIDDATDRTVNFRPWWVAGQISSVTLSNVELYVNNIFVNPEVHDIYIKRIGFSLIRVFRRHRVRTNQEGSDDRLLSQLKWPIEYMFVCLRPSFNQNANNPNQHRDWHRCTKVVDLICDQRDDAEGASGALAPADTSSIGEIYPTRYVVELKTMDVATLSAHGINIHDNFPTRFFDSYNPFHYGGPAIITPNDQGAMMINFALFPGSYQPNGHLNISRAREFFLAWTTSYVTANTPADLNVCAKAINFLLITDGSAVLRYST